MWPVDTRWDGLVVPGAIIAGMGRYVTGEDGPGAKAQQRPAGEDLFR